MSQLFDVSAAIFPSGHLLAEVEGKKADLLRRRKWKKNMFPLLLYFISCIPLEMLVFIHSFSLLARSTRGRRLQQEEAKILHKDEQWHI